MTQPQETTDQESLSVVLPVFNEESILEQNVHAILSFMRSTFRCEWEIVIADNGSTDGTPRIGQALADLCPEVKYLRIDRNGVGIALRTAWKCTKADILCHVDADLPFELDDIEHVIKSAQEGYDVCLGSRFTIWSRNDAKPLRRFFSRAFHVWVKLFFSYQYSDICGVKAIRRKAFLDILPDLSADGWFFNTELMLLADSRDMLIKEIPVRMNDHPRRKSKVNLWQTTVNLLILTVKLKLRFWMHGAFGRSRRERYT